MLTYEEFRRCVDRNTQELERRFRPRWIEASDDYTDSGALNPLDRINTIPDSVEGVYIYTTTNTYGQDRSQFVVV